MTYTLLKMILSYKKLILVSLTAILFWMMTSHAFAAIQLDPNLQPDGLPEIDMVEVDTDAGTENEVIGETAATQSLILFVGNIVSQVLLFAGAVSIFFLIVSGANYILAFGKDERIEKGKRGIFWSIMGLLVILLSYSIVRGAISLLLQVDS